MAIIKGRSKAKDMMTTLDTILKAAGYTEISSNIPIDGQVYKTMGESGTSEFYIRLIPTTFHYLNVYVYESYTPAVSSGVSGVFGSGRHMNSIIWSTSSLPDIDVDYIINITKNRMIIFVEGEENDSRSSSSLSYIGLPIRYGAEDTTGSFAGIAAIGAVTNIGNIWYALRGRSLIAQFPYTYAFYSPNKSYAWGAQLFLSPIILGHADEGPRGELEDLLLVKSPDSSYEARHKDTFIRDGKEYILLGKFYNVSGSLPNAWYAMRI